jgi:RNA 3'-terminal phosphate cyclase
VGIERARSSASQAFGGSKPDLDIANAKNTRHYAHGTRSRNEDQDHRAVVTGKGTLLSLMAEFGGLETGRSQCLYFSLGELGKRAERDADEAVDALEAFLDTGGVIDHYLADQLLLPLAFARGTSYYRISQVTQHLLTTPPSSAFSPVTILIGGKLEGRVT